jgi:hypothetical protein
LPLYLAGPMNNPGQPPAQWPARLAAHFAGQHAAGPLAVHLGSALLSGRFLLLLIAGGLLLICMLAVPVLSDVFLSYASAQGAKIARSTFLLGLCVLLLGLVIRILAVDIVGAALMGAVILGIILENYLATSAPTGLSRRRRGSAAGSAERGLRARAAAADPLLAGSSRESTGAGLRWPR